MEKIQYNTHHERSEESFRTFGLLDGSYLGREESIVDAVFRGAGRVSSTVTVQDMDLSGNPEISNKASLSQAHSLETASVRETGVLHTEIGCWSVIVRSGL